MRFLYASGGFRIDLLVPGYQVRNLCPTSWSSLGDTCSRRGANTDRCKSYSVDVPIKLECAQNALFVTSSSYSQAPIWTKACSYTCPSLTNDVGRADRFAGRKSCAR